MGQKRIRIKKKMSRAILEAWKQAGQDETVIYSKDLADWYCYAPISFRKIDLPLRKARRSCRDL